MRYIGSLDQGTSSTRFMIFDESGALISQHQLEHRQILPQAGWVEHDAEEIWQRSQEVITGALEKAKDDGYFGYKFRILKRQGGNVEGGDYDYVITGNMIGGYALMAWPARYAETGVNTFAVNQAGIVYEKDFGVNTENIVAGIKSFNPNDSWSVVED